MDIVMRMFMVHGVLAKAIIASPGESMPRLPDLTRSYTLTLDLSVEVGAEAQEPDHGTLDDVYNITHELKAERIQSANWAKVAKQEVSKVEEDEVDEVAVDPMSSTFGSGGSMVRLYGK
jgi:hypothetical protein